MEFYRYEIRNYSPLEGTYFINPTVTLITFNLHKETPHGYWIGFGENKEGILRSKSRWIPKQSRKRYAYPTKLEAMDSFIKRTTKRHEILSNTLTVCTMALRDANIMYRDLVKEDAK